MIDLDMRFVEEVEGKGGLFEVTPDLDVGLVSRAEVLNEDRPLRDRQKGVKRRHPGAECQTL